MDQEFEDFYAHAYRVTRLDPREAVSPSPLLRKFVRRARGISSHDEQNWIERASAYIVRQAKCGEVDALITFAQPWVNHLVGLEVRRTLPKLPWIAHFSDPWVDSPYNAMYAESVLMLPKWRAQEAAVVSQADRIFFVTRQTAQLVMRKYPAEMAGKVGVMPHGFDADLRGLATAPASRGPLRMVYVGNVYAGMRDPLALLEAISALQHEVLLDGKLEVHFYGHGLDSVAADVERLSLAAIVRVHGPISYMESLKQMGLADLLLLLDAKADVNVFLPSKVVDYVMTGKPILALTPGAGATSEVLRPIGHMVLDPANKSELVEVLRKAVTRKAEGAKLAELDPAIAEAYNIDATTRPLLAAIADLVGTPL